MTPNEIETFTWTPPGEIDGDPAQVADLVEQQLREFGEVATRIVHESFVQLRNAGLSEILETPGPTQKTDAVLAWVKTERGRAAGELVAGLGRLIRAIDALTE